MGWVNRRRDLGTLIFVDIRDRSGVTQVVFSEELNAAIHAKAELLRNEYVIAAVGTVKLRDADTVNKNIPTGEVELVADELLILNEAKHPPFLPSDTSLANEEMRLKYRYLDLRRDAMQFNIELRHKVALAIRDCLASQGFFEIETPFMTRSTPEGARDYLVPSRVNPGKFYALPQSPQLLKQILMIGGFDRYYQIARCFRDEDLRANRQPEFSQIDIEMTGPRPEDIQSIAEGMIASVYRRVLDIDVKPPFPRMRYDEAMDRFGNDKPDLRFDLELKNLTSAFFRTQFKVFAEIIARGESIYGINVTGDHTLSRRELDELTETVKTRYSMGLAWVKVGDAGWQGPIAKHVADNERESAARIGNVKQGDTLLMVGGPAEQVRPVLGEIRLQLGTKFGLDKSEELKFLWITDFPLFDYSADDKRLVSVNHPFTAPHPDDLAMLEASPLKARALAYDMVLNGQELGGGSIRIHSRELQLKVFELLGLSREEAIDRFGFLLDALKYGAPPHGGIAFGVDRICMMLCGTDSLRDVIAFPKTQKAVDPMSGAPSEVDARQLKELSIKVTS